MHSPETVAFEINYPWRSGKSMLFPKGYRHPFITIWHIDPCTDGTDDSCGRFLRDRHLNQDKLKQVEREFEFNIKNNYWFTENGVPIFSTQGVLLQMYTKAAWIHFKLNRRKLDRFMRKHLYDILYSAENPVDCMGDSIINKWGHKGDKYRLVGMASIVYADICRKDKVWYKNPKWHFWHWRFQVHPLQRLKRRFWDKCSVCGKRGFKSVAFGNWNGDMIWHQECNTKQELVKQ